MPSNTERAVAELFTKLPASLDDLSRRLANLSRKHVCRLLVDRLHLTKLSEADLDLIRDALGIVGAGPEATRLSAIASDETRPEAVRGVAYLLLSSGSRSTFDALEDRLDSDKIGQLESAAMAHDMRRMRTEPARAELVTAVLRAAESDADFGTALDRLEAQRKALGLPAALAYGDALYHLELPLDRIDRLVAITESEDCHETVTAFAQVVVMVEELEARERMRLPWMRARARRAAPLGGEAWISDPDSEGVIGVFGWFLDEAGGETEPKHTLVEVTFGEEGVLSTRMEPWADEEFVQSFLEDLADSTGVSFTESLLPDAASVVAEAAARGHSPEHEPALQMFRVHGS